MIRVGTLRGASENYFGRLEIDGPLNDVLDYGEFNSIGISQSTTSDRARLAFESVPLRASTTDNFYGDRVCVYDPDAAGSNQVRLYACVVEGTSNLTAPTHT